MMKNYHFSPATFEYLSVSNARLDPLLSSNNGKDIYLQPPAYSTRKNPPVVTKNHIAIFSLKDDSWSVVKDCRGIQYWLQDRSHHTIEQLGDGLPVNALNTEPPKPFIDLQKDALIATRLFAADARKKITAGADIIDIAGWPDKAAIALRVVKSEAIDTEIAAIQQEANDRSRGETVIQLAQRQLAIADWFRMARASVDGLTDAAISAIENATEETLAQVVLSIKANAKTRLGELLASRI